MIGRLAVRNLGRNRWRTVMTVAGVAMGVAILIWLNGYMDGFADEIVRGATSAELGQVQISTPEWAEKPAARYSFEASDDLLAEIEGSPGVGSVSPRVSLFGLVGNEDRSGVARITGVDPAREAATTVVATGVREGRWLSPTPPEYPAPREVVLGVKFAEQLKVSVGDELVAFFEAADGSLGNELLEVVGIVRSGNTSIDRQTAFVHIEDLRIAGAMEGRLHHVAVKVDDPRLAEGIADALNEQLGDDLVARSWQEVLPEIDGILQTMEASDGIMYVFVYILVAFGLFNAQRMSALERRREFAVMMAVGVTPRRLFGTVLLETILIGLVGAAVGAVVGVAGTWYFVVNGLDLAAFNTSGDMNFEMMGISFSNQLRFVLTPESVYKPIAVLVPFAALCGLWPALTAARIEITKALSGRN